MMKPKCRSIVEAETPKHRQFSRFIFQTGWDGWGDPWRSFINSYEEAFYELAEVILANPARSKTLSMPLAYLCRHSIELALKAAIDIVDRGFVDDVDTNTHGLMPLWRYLQEMLREDNIDIDEAWCSNCEKYVAHIHEMDRVGDTFRYPTDRRGKLRLTVIEIENMVRAQWIVSGYCHWAMIAHYERNNDLANDIEFE